MSAELKIPNGGPSWKWLVGIQLGALAFCFGLGITLLMNQFESIDHRLSAIEASLSPIQSKLATDDTVLADHDTQIKQLWDKWGKDHDMLTRDDYTLSIDHNWIQAQAHANTAIRRLHDGQN